MDLVERLSLANGAEARLFRDGIGWRFELEEGGKRYVDRFDPRDDDGTLVVAPTRWTEPDGEPMDERLHDAVIAAFWTLAEKTSDVARMIEWRPERRCNVARRWTPPTDGFLARVSSHPKGVEYMELGRTAWFPASYEGRIATLDPSGAQWKYPDEVALDVDERERIAARLRRASAREFVLSERGWTLA